MAEAAQPTRSVENGLLTRLPPDDRARLAPELRCVNLEFGHTLYFSGQRPAYFYFPLDAIVAKLHFTAGGDSTGLGVIGHEGMVGMAALIGGGQSDNETLVIKSGAALRIGRQALAHEFERGGPLQEMLLHFLQAFIAQTGQVAVCNRHHHLEQQLCSWLLLYLERAPGEELRVTQELIASLLGVRREGVTRAALKLKRDGLLDYRHGRITIHDPARIRARACECQRVIRKAYRSLLPPPVISNDGTIKRERGECLAGSE